MPRCGEKSEYYTKENGIRLTGGAHLSHLSRRTEKKKKLTCFRNTSNYARALQRTNKFMNPLRQIDMLVDAYLFLVSHFENIIILDKLINLLGA